MRVSGPWLPKSYYGLSEKRNAHKIAKKKQKHTYKKKTQEAMASEIAHLRTSALSARLDIHN